MSFIFDLVPEGQAWSEYNVQALTPEELEQIVFNSKMITISGWIVFIILFALLIFMIIQVRKGKLFSLNNRMKKVGFIIFLFGYTLFSYGLILAIAKLKPLSENYVLTDIFNSIKLSIEFARYYEANIFLGSGFYILVLGMFLIFLYDRSVGKIFNWIKSPSQ